MEPVLLAEKLAENKRKLCKFCKKAGRVSDGYAIHLVCT